MTPLFIPKNLGAKRSVPDWRDHVARAAAEAIQPQPLPGSLATDFSKFPQVSQQQTPACVSHAWARLVMLWWFLKTGQVVPFSPRAFHILSGMPIYNGGWAAGPDDGRDPRTVAQISKVVGCPTESTVPNNTLLDNASYFDVNLITPAVLAEAAQYKIPGYVSVALSQIAFRTNVQKYGGVSMLADIGTGFWVAPNGQESWAQADIDPIRPPASQADVVSGHETVVSGYNTQALEHGVNSWGPTWDSNGEFNFIWNDWESYIYEGWAIAELDTSTLVLLQSLPKAGQFKHNFQSQLTAGMNNDEVKMLQVALCIDGEFTYPELTGYYGTITAAAVLAFQRKYQVADSVTLSSLAGARVGPATLKALDALYSS